MISRISFQNLRTSCKNFIYESLIPFLWRCSKSSYYSNRRSLSCFAVNSKKIGIIVWNYAGHNIGDEIIFRTLCGQIKKYFHNYYIILNTYSSNKFIIEWKKLNVISVYDGVSFINRYIIKHLINLITILFKSKLNNAKIIIIGGGDVYHKNHITDFLIISILSKLIRYKIIWYFIGIVEYPYNYLHKLFFIITFKLADVISVRDVRSASFTASLRKNISDIIIGPDPAFLFEANSSSNYNTTITEDKIKTIAINIRSDEPAYNLKISNLFLNKFANIIDSLIKDFNYNITFIPFDFEGNDERILKKLFTLIRMKEKINFLTVYNVNDVINEFRKVDICIGMRLHFNILSLLNNKPTMIISYSPKTTMLANQLEIPYLTIREIEESSTYLDQFFRKFSIVLSSINTINREVLKQKDAAYYSNFILFKKIFEKLKRINKNYY